MSRISPSYSYDDEDYEEGRKNGKNQRNDRSLLDKESGGFCSLTKILVLLVLLGAGFGATFAFVGWDTIKGWFGAGAGGGSGTTDDEGAPEYEFMQCPDEGECCNGLESNCDLRVNEMLYATVHNANHDSLLVSNHDAPFEGSLDRGYRGLMFDVCKCDDGNGNMQIEFCHTFCGIGPRDPTEVFQNVNKFLNQNPSEFIVFNFEMSTSEDDQPPTQADLWELMQPIEGFRKKTYDHSGGQWPTARELIETDKRIILFQHNGNDCPTGNEANCAPRIENFFDYAVENEWDFDSVDAISDTSKFCAGKRGVNSKKQFYSLNNFVTTDFGPWKPAADEINEKDFILNLLDECKKETGLDANFVNIDFWQRGDAPEVAQIVNTERAARRRKRVMNRFLGWIQS